VSERSKRAGRGSPEGADAVLLAELLPGSEQSERPQQKVDSQIKDRGVPRFDNGTVADRRGGHAPRQSIGPRHAAVVSVRASRRRPATDRLERPRGGDRGRGGGGGHADRRRGGPVRRHQGGRRVAVRVGRRSRRHRGRPTPAVRRVRVSHRQHRRPPVGGLPRRPVRVPARAGHLGRRRRVADGQRRRPGRDPRVGRVAAGRGARPDRVACGRRRPGGPTGGTRPAPHHRTGGLADRRRGRGRPDRLGGPPEGRARTGARRRPRR